MLAKHKFDSSERGWEAYTPQQLQIVEEICQALKAAYGIKEILGHDDIAPSRKRDPGPAFPLESLQGRVMFGRNEDLPDEPDDEALIDAAVVFADNLNIRSNPSTNASMVSNPLSKGTKVRILKSQGGWSYVKADIEGWVSNQWLRNV